MANILETTFWNALYSWDIFNILIKISLLLIPRGAHDKKAHNISVLKKVTSNIWKETCIHDLVNIYIVVSLEHPDDKASLVNELNTVQEEANT